MKKAAILLSIILTSCASIEKVELTSGGSPSGELLIYREPSSLASGEGMYVGKDEKYFAALDNGEYKLVRIDAGQHSLYAKSHASPSFKINVNIEEGKKTCVKGKVNSSVAAVMLVPLMGNSVNHFNLEEVPCPDESFLEDYKMVTEL